MSSIDIQDIDINALMRGLVHELRNPLSAILTASNLLQAGADLDEETAMLLEVVQKESRRMNRILLEFSAFVKPPAARLEPFDLARTIRNVVGDMQREGGITEKIAVHDSLPETLYVSGDPEHIRRAIAEILENAAEELERGGTISLHAIAAKHRVELSIEDSGGGLETAELDKVFQPFYSTKPQSTGLGLAVARVAARSSGGDITFEKKESDGARVVLVLPAAEPESGNADDLLEDDKRSVVSSHSGPTS